MRALGSSFNSQIRASRDFEESERVLSFLARRGFQNSVELISPGVLRLKATTENLITDDILGVFYEDLGKASEAKILDLFKAELNSIKDGDLVRVYLSFRANKDKTSLKSTIFYSVGATSLGFTLFPEMPPISDDSIEQVLAEHPNLAWVIDPESPLYMQTVVDNLRLHLLFKIIIDLEVPRESLRLFKGYARKLLIEKSKDARSVPSDLVFTSRKLQTFIKAQSNMATPITQQVKCFTTGDGYEEHQVIVTVIGAQPFTIACGVRIFTTTQDHKEVTAIAVRAGFHGVGWGDLFHAEYIKSTLEFDAQAIRYALVLFGYRVPTRKAETVYAESLKAFPGYSISTGPDGSVVASIVKSRRFPAPNSIESMSQFAKESLDLLSQFCSSKKIGFGGRAYIRGVGKDLNQTILPTWEMADGWINQKMVPQRGADELEFYVELYFQVGLKTKTDYLDYPAQVVSRLGEYGHL